ncbi:MAG: DUF3616 domain-containing protein [Phycisphaerae bacterium]|nr:DUF3616 domain-containing protein [Planctomycetota bacterium]MBL7220074.1 DUF3616 domain-containing protein [Phycisphaerae bacterium]
MTGHRARKTAYILVPVVVAGLLVIAAPNCGERRPKQEIGKEGRTARPGRTHLGVIPEGDASWVVFRGASDASAAIALDDRTLLVADDENNILCAYGVKGGAPVFRFDLTDFLGVVGKFPEVDIEAAARIGDRAYWISSHGRNRNGKWRPNRCRFFATDIIVGPRGITVRRIGRPYAGLAQKMAADPGIRKVCPGLAGSFHHGKLDGDRRRRLAPKDRGLNIEGLCASADGNSLYIGLRNPLAASPGASDDRAIVVPLLNPAEVVEKSRRPRFGRPMLWNLGGLGIRDMVRSRQHGATFVLAGAKGDRGRFFLYRWSGQGGEQPALLRRLDFHKYDWRPEALVVFPRSTRLLLLSDDGVVPVPVGGPAECLDPEHYRGDGTSLNKHLRDESRKFFRARWIAP